MLASIASLSSVLVDHLQQLVVHGFSLFGGTGTNRMSGAVSEMIAHQGTSDRSDRLLSRRDLRENIGAVAVLFHHALQAADLAFDSSQPAQVRSLDRGIDADRFTSGQVPVMRAEVFLGRTAFQSVLLRGHIFPYASFSLRNRRLLVTTLNELSAMAALAITGLSINPKTGYSAPAASGIPITL